MERQGARPSPHQFFSCPRTTVRIVPVTDTQLALHAVGVPLKAIRLLIIPRTATRALALALLVFGPAPARLWPMA